MTPQVKRLWTTAGVCLGITVLASLLEWWGPARLREVEFYTQDLRLQHGRLAEIHPDLAFIGIDSPNYADFYGDEDRRANRGLALASENWPWSREVWSVLIERLLEGGAKVVALDIMFANPGTGDDLLKATLDRHRDRVVLAAGATLLSSDRGDSYSLLLPSSTILDPGTNHPMMDPRVGSIKMETDQAGGVGVVRRAVFGDEEKLHLLLPPGVHTRSFAARILTQAGLSNAVPPGDDARRFRYCTTPLEPFPVVPLHQVLVDGYWKTNYGSGKVFRDAIVIVGPLADIFQDHHRTPFLANMPGPEIHLNILSAAMNNEWLTESSLVTNILLCLWAGVGAWLLAWRFPNLLVRFILACVAFAAFIVTAQLLYDHANVFVAMVLPSGVLSGGTLVCMVYDFTLARRDKAQLRRTLERYVSKDVVRELIDNPQTYLNSLVGVRRPVSILFSDLRGFTTLTEQANAALLVKQLNEYFQEMVGIVVRNRGRLDKFIGDAVMADWGSFVTAGPKQDAERAVLSALQMRSSLEGLNARWVTQGFKPLAIGIGINHGEVIVGNLGSEEKMEVSVIGDSVNLASRLEGLTKEYFTDLLLGESVATLVRGRFTLRTVDLVTVKGKTKPVEVFTIPPEAGESTTALPWLERHEQGVRDYRSRKFSQALSAFQSLTEDRPGDLLAALYVERCQALVNQPPGPDWSGVFEALKK